MLKDSVIDRNFFFFAKLTFMVILVFRQNESANYIQNLLATRPKLQQNISPFIESSE